MQQQSRRFKLPKVNLLVKIIIAIVIAVILSTVVPSWFVRGFVTFSSLFANFLSFIIPLLIVGLVAPGIAELGKRAGPLLGVTLFIAYFSTIFSGFFSYFTTAWSLPHLLDSGAIAQEKLVEFGEGFLPWFTIEMPPLMGVTTSLLLAFILGLGTASVNAEKLKGALIEFREIIIKIIEAIIIPLLPYYIFAIFLKIGAEGEVAMVMGLFIKLIVIIFIMHIALLLIQFITAGAIAKVNPFRALATMFPAYMTALGTQSSAATIPVTLMQTKKLGVDEEIADFVIPLSATVHLAGSILKIVSCAYAIIYINGMAGGLNIFAGFIMMLGITMVAAPGVPGGAIMAAIALLQSHLGFDQNMIGMMVALYITIDSFGTACNITGDGAIALIVDKINKNKL